MTTRLPKMREIIPNTSAFPTARCEPCGKSVLTYVALDHNREETRYCVHCDAPILSSLRWLSAAELEAEGYEIGYRPSDEKPKSGGACSAGCGSCARK